MLGAPPVFHQFPRQPIQQSRMCGRRADLTEIIEAADNAATEVMLPHAVHPHARGEWMLRTGNPLRQGQAVTSLVSPDNRGWLKGLFRKYRGQGGVHQRTRTTRITP